MTWRIFTSVLMIVISTPAWSWFPNRAALGSVVQYGADDVEEIILDDQPFQPLRTSTSITISEPEGGFASARSDALATWASSDVHQSLSALSHNFLSMEARNRYTILTQITGVSESLPDGEWFALRGLVRIAGTIDPTITGKGNGGASLATYFVSNNSYTAFGLTAQYAEGQSSYDRLVTVANHEGVYDGAGASSFVRYLDFLLPVSNGYPMDIQFLVESFGAGAHDPILGDGVGSVYADISVQWGGFYDAVVLGSGDPFGAKSESIDFTITDPSGFDWKRNYITPVPEPSITQMMLIGLIGILYVGRLRCRHRATFAYPVIVAARKV